MSQADNNLKAEILNYKKALTKSMKDDQHEHINDVLTALTPLTLSASIIQSTKIGALVAEIKKNYSSNSTEIGNKIIENTKILLVKWKRVLESAGKVSKGTTTQTNQPTESTQESEETEQLGEQRQTVLDLFATILSDVSSKAQKSTSTATPMFVMRKAREVEAAVNELFPHESQSKAYATKARTLAFNLKRNPILRANVIHGATIPIELVQMTADELANQEMAEKRKLAQQESSDERRLDWLEEHREQIQKDIGIAPTEFEYEELTLSDNDD